MSSGVGEIVDAALIDGLEGNGICWVRGLVRGPALWGPDSRTIVHR